MIKQKVWRVKQVDPVLQYILTRELNIMPIVASLLINRGIRSVEAARVFLDCRLEHLGQPAMMKGMDVAVNRILSAIRGGERVLVYGDYDVDGVTSTAMLVKVLTRLGAQVDYYIPNRLEQGYGLHAVALQQIRTVGYNLLITVDCGISNVVEVEENNRLRGPDIIITDHHEPPSLLPPALAIVNPKQGDCPYPFKELAGVGVAAKLVQALMEQAGEGPEAWQAYLDLICLGTVADIVPLQDENRIFVKYGLSRLAGTDNPGLQALMKISRLTGEELSTREVGFALAPRLNAAGRIGDPRWAVDLLLCNDPGRAGELAQKLEHGNQARQKVESAVRAEAVAMVEQDPNLAEKHVLVLASAGWHPGVIGIVASRLMERFNRPALVINLENGEGKGSARSIPGFNLHHALTACGHLLENFGGHAQAAGFSVREENLARFAEELNGYAGRVMTDDFILPDQELDDMISLENISGLLIEQIAKMEPFGQGNPVPLLGCRAASVINCRVVGRSGAHLKLLVQGDGVKLDGIAFNLGSYAPELSINDPVDLAFIPELNEWNGRQSLQLNIKDINKLNRYEKIHPYRDCQKIGQDFKGHTENFLIASSPLSFRPEFINDQLVEQQNNVVNSCAINQSGEDNLLLIDERNCGHRGPRLAELALSGGITLVVGGSPAQTVEIARGLLLNCPDLTGRVESTHGMQSNAERKIILEQLAAGNITVIVSTPTFVPLFKDFAKRVVLRHLPFSPGEWLSALAGAPYCQLYLLYGRESQWWNIDRLKALAVNRDYLGALYTFLCRREKSGRPGFLINEAMGIAGNGKKSIVREYSVLVGISVFKELGLLKWHWEQGKVNYTMLDRPGEKIRLDLSRTYRQVHLLANKLIPWQHQMVDLPVECLKTLVKNIYNNNVEGAV